MRFRVEVTDNDILKGVKAGINSCPIARALKRNQDIVQHSISVTEDEITFKTRDGKRHGCYEVPQKAADFIAKFDGFEGKKRVKPFVFTFPVETESENFASA